METAAQCEARLDHPYQPDQRIAERLEVLARRVYGAGAVQLAPVAADKIRRLEAERRGAVPICMAKTQSSLSHGGQFKGRPSGFVLMVRDVRLCAGAGFLVAYAGDIMTMPGLGRKPACGQVGLDTEGNTVGLL